MTQFDDILSDPIHTLRSLLGQLETRLAHKYLELHSNSSNYLEQYKT